MIRKKLVKQAVGCLMALTMVMTNSYMGIEGVRQTETVAYGEESTYTVGNSTYTYQVLDDGTIEITYYIGTDTEIVIPAEINGKRVTKIGSYAFRYASYLSSVEICDNVTSIDHHAFSGCYNLTSIIIPDNVTSMGNYAFYGCYSLTSIKIPKGVTGIGERVFARCDKLTSINIPDNVTSIGEGAFSYCSSLASIVIPESVTKIDSYAFNSCSSLERIIIPKNVAYIGECSFAACSSLKEIEVESENIYYKSQEGILFDADMSELIQYPCRKNNDVYVIPNSVNVIGQSAFQYCNNLTSVEIPSGVSNIGVSVFEGCSKLTSIKIPDSVTSIGGSAFANCSSLTSIDIPEGVTFIGDWAFYGCSQLSSVIIPNGVTNIGENTFYGCSSLTSVVIPNRVTNIGDYSFSGCSSLVSVVIQKGVTGLGDGAFSGCSSLSEVELPEGVTNIGNYGFSSCSSLENIVIPESVTSIGESPFDNCSSLKEIDVETENTNYKSREGVLFNKDMSILINYPAGKENASYVIPNSVICIGWNAFSGCSKLTSVEIANSVTNIDMWAFRNCSSLSYIEIPKSVIDMSIDVFSGCIGLEKIEVDVENPNYTSQDGILFSSDMSVLIKYPAKKKNDTYEIPDSVMSMDWNSFEGCSNLINIVIPKSVTSISYNEFSGCSNLEKIEVEEGNPNYKAQDGILFNIDMSYLKKYPEGKKNKTYMIPDSVTDIDDYAFSKSIYLEKIEVEEGNQNYISKDGILFNMDMSELIRYPSRKNNDTYAMPNGITIIDLSAFQECKNLKNIEIPDSVTNIGWCAFSGCDNLTIYGKKGSYAEQFAYENNISFASMMIKLIDNETNIEVNCPEESINTNVSLKTKYLTPDDDEYKKINLTNKIADSTVKPENVKLSAYDISLVDENNSPVQPNGTVTVKIPCPAGFKGENCKVYRVEEFGGFTDMNAKYQNGYLVFETDHFSTYIITETELITGIQVIKGDANGDGNMDIKDSAIIKRYLAGWDVEIDTTAADLDGDGKVTIKDSALIKRQLAGWE